MPDAALSAYLAKNYLDGAKAEALLARSGASVDEKRKRKKKKVNDEGESSSSRKGLKLVDENDESWRRRRDSDEEAVTVAVEAENERRRKGKWGRVGGQEAFAGVEAQEDEKPQMAGEDGLGLDDSTQAAVEKKLEEQKAEKDEVRKPSIRAGLKTKEEMRAERLERERLAAAANDGDARGSVESARESEKRKREKEERAQETVYRDASGRRIDTQKEDEEKRIAKEEDRRREKDKKDWNKGQVQLDRAREAKRREEEEKNTSFARYSNDERMNKELRSIQRAADPALGFLTRKTVSKGPQKPAYKGSFPPNRFNIRPGYRWDGVERSNGFEAKYFQKKHQRAHRNEEMDAWGKEDM